MRWLDDDFYHEKEKKPKSPSKQLFHSYRKIVQHSVVVLIIILTAGTALAMDQRIDTNKRELNQNITYTINKMVPTVVSVRTYQASEGNRFNGYGIGSGVIFAKNRKQFLIVTNSHVVANGEKYEITTFDSKTYNAQLIGEDPITDLAVLAMDNTDLQHIATFGDSDQLQIGESVIALGNPLGLGDAPTVTKGIISALKRNIPVSFSEYGFNDWEMEVMQTDAAINQGNSGGPLINELGEVIGINSAKIANTGVEGLGFAIPINDAKPVIEQLLKTGEVKRAMMGIVPIDLGLFGQNKNLLRLPNDVQAGVVVMEVSGEASKVGLEPRDVIVRLDKQPIKDTLALRKYIFQQKSIGDSMIVTYYRDGERKRVKMRLMERK